MVVTGDYNALVVLGPTATGKTALGVCLARAFSGEIISADSRQVYRGLDLGSGKDLEEYGEIPYHLIDITDLGSEYSVFDFQRDFSVAFNAVRSKGALPVIVGGTGMYLDSIIRGYSFEEVPENQALRKSLECLSVDELVSRLLSVKKEVHNRTDLVDRSRLIRAIEIAEFKRDDQGNRAERKSALDFRPLILGVRVERAELRARIRTRLLSRIGEGMIEEVNGLHASGASWERLERLGLEYRITAEYLQGKIADKKQYTEELNQSIGQFAKRQETWFRGMERKGVQVNWIENGNRDEAISLASRYFRKDNL
jgi:tRNA dimethylallyltransferase